MSIENNKGLEQALNQDNNNLDDYLNSELKLQSEIDKKLQNPDLQEVAREELQEIKTKFQNSLSNVNESLNSGMQDVSLESKSKIKNFKDSFVVKDLLDDFKQDLEALNNIEEVYKEYDGYNEFIKLLKSNDISEEEKEKIYTIFTDTDNNEELEYFLYNNEGLPRNKIEIESLISEFRKSSIEQYGKTEILEILNNEGELENNSLNELIYMKNDLILLRENTDTETKEKINKRLADLDINIDLKRKNILKQVTEEEKQVTEEEKQVTEEEKQVTEEEKQVTEEEKQVKEIEINNLKNLIPKIKDFPFEKIVGGQDLKNKILELETADNNKEIEICKEIAKLLIDGNLLADIMDLAEKSGNKTYEDVRSFFYGVANLSGNIILSQALLKYPPVVSNDIGNKPIELSGYFGNTGNVLKEGDKYIQGDMIIDMGVKPPKIGTFEKTTKYSLDIENTYSKEIEENAILKNKVYNEMLDLKTKEYDLKSKVDTLKLYLNDNKKLEEFALKEGKTTDEIKTDILETINNFEQEILILKEKYNEKREKYVKLQNTNFSKELIDKKEEQRQTLKFLHSIGFDLIPQNISDAIIARINTQRYMGIINSGNHGFQIYGKIDLSKGEFGEGNLTTINKKELFTKLFNLMLTGDPTKPINVENVIKNRGTGITPNQINEILYNKENSILSMYGANYNQLDENLGLKKLEKKKQYSKSKEK